MNQPNSIEKQTILSKLSYLVSNVPLPHHTLSKKRQWISEAKALIDQYDPSQVRIYIDSELPGFQTSPTQAIIAIEGYVTDTIEKIKLELELEGPTEIGSAYSAGEVYRYFADFKQILEKATQEILVVDPYLDGKTFNEYFTDCPNNLDIRLLIRQYVKSVKPYIARHETEYKTRIALKTSEELHDRIFIIDNAECWLSGASLKDAATSKPAYLLSISSPILEDKIRIYNEIWDKAKTS